MSKAIIPAAHASMPNPACRPPAPCQGSSFKQIASARQQAHISLTTREGDQVTISSQNDITREMAMRQNISPGRHLQEFTLAVLETGSYNVTVQGDLSDAELADINRLLHDLTAIAGDFFGGRTEAALTSALGLGDMGSLAELSATFMRQITVASRFDSRALLPAHDTDSTLPGFPSAPNEISRQELLQAQWQQIMAYLEEHGEERRSGDQQEKHGAMAPVAERMLEKVKATMTSHPRLTPLSAALGRQAIEAATPPTASDRRETLWPEYLQQLNDWLLSA